jgi:hypothetical protein
MLTPRSQQPNSGSTTPQPRPGSEQEGGRGQSSYRLTGKSALSAFQITIVLGNGPIFIKISHSQDSHKFRLRSYSVTHAVIMLVTTPAPAICKSSSLSVKKAMLAEAVDTRCKQTAKKYNVSPKRIRAWKKSFDKHAPNLSETFLSSRSRK